MSGYVPMAQRMRAPVVTVTVKVGLDEWVVVSRGALGRQVDLCTAGLSGCVAVVLMSAGQACLSHVFSACDNDGAWTLYQHQLELPVTVMRQISPVTSAALVYSEGTPKFLPGKIREWLTGLVGGDSVREFQASGVRISWHSLGYWAVISKEADANQAAYTHGYLTTASGTASIDNWGSLSGSSSRAS